MNDHLDIDERIGEFLRRELPVPEHREGYRESVAALVAAEAAALAPGSRRKWMPKLRRPHATRADGQSGGLKQASALKRMSGLRVAIFASIAVVLVAAGSFMAVRNLAHPDFVLAITDDNVVGTGAQTGHWEHLQLSSDGQAVTSLAVDPKNPSILYAGTYEGLFKSSDGAATWSRLSMPAGGLGPFSINIDPASPSTLYSVFLFETDDASLQFQSFRLLRSDDGGGTWVELKRPGLTGAPPRIGGYGPFGVWFDTTSTPSTIYMQPYGIYYLARSTDRGETWTALSPKEEAEAKSKYEAEREHLSTGFEGTVSDADFGSGLQIRVGQIDPSNPWIRYAATEKGVYKSTDGGKSWKAANTGLTSSVVLSLVADPGSPSNLYATTAVGIFKSGDGGTTWSEIRGGQGSVVLAPSSPSTLYAWTSAGLFRTDDGGSNWTPLAGTGLVSTTVAPDGSTVGRLILVIPGDPDTLLAVSADGLSLLRSADGGKTWSPSGAGVMPPVPNPQNPSTLYAAAASDQKSAWGWHSSADRVVKSTDAGATWNDVSPQGWLGVPVADISVDPHAPSNVYVLQENTSGFTVARSLDGGTTWHQVKLGGAAEHLHGLFFDPRSSDTLYALTDLGSASAALYRTTDGGSTWTNITGELAESLEHGWPAVQQYMWSPSVVTDPASSNGLYAITPEGAFKWVPGGN